MLRFFLSWLYSAGSCFWLRASKLFVHQQPSGNLFTATSYTLENKCVKKPSFSCILSPLLRYISSPILLFSQPPSRLPLAGILFLIILIRSEAPLFRQTAIGGDGLPARGRKRKEVQGSQNCYGRSCAQLLAPGCSERLRRSGGSRLLGAKPPGVEGTRPFPARSSCPGSGLPDLDGWRGRGAAPSVLRTEDSPAGTPAPHLPARARPPAPPAGSPPLTAALAALALAHRSAPPSARAQTAKLSKSCGKGTSERSWTRGGAGTPRPQGTATAAGP